MHPFWQGNTMTNESMLLVSYNGGTPEAPFLFPYTNIIAVKNAALTITYTPGTDWLYANNKLILPTGSRIPYVKDIDLAPNMSIDPAYFHEHQIAVTYTHSGTWQGPIPIYASSTLPHIIGKLSRQEAVRMVLYGDSISVGWNVSSLLGKPPYLPVWGQLVANTLQKTYHSPITFINPSVAGQTSTWGVQNVHNLVSSQSPDLVIIAFGMNDGLNMPPSIIPIDTTTFKNNLLKMIQDVKAISPQAEFILVSPTLMHPAYAGSIQASYKTAIQSLVAPGIVMADMTGVHQELLKTKKFADITGNNINHPNDFLVRWYAQEVAGLLISPTTASPPSLLPGDLDGNGNVDIFDYNQLITNFGKTNTTPGWISADINKSGKVDIFDYTILVGNFGH